VIRTTLAITLIAGLIPCLSPLSGQNKTNSADSAALPNKEPEFKLAMIGNGFGPAGVSTTLTYSAPDGKRVRFRKKVFASADDAKKEGDRIVKLATAVIEHSSTTAGKVTNDRWMLSVPRNTDTDTVIVLTRDANLWEIASTSAQDALAFEKQLKRDIRWTDKSPQQDNVTPDRSGNRPLT
jgi:hypothetical protein